jgi:molybdopterin molybdotransferase
MNERVLSFEAALAEVKKHARAIAAPREAHAVPLLEAAGRILAAPLLADRDQPPFDRSTRDGFAVRSSDLAAGERTLRVIGSVRAGEAWRGTPLAAGESIEIMTGAPLPEGADAVVMVEHAPLTDETIQIASERNVRSGDNVVPRGAEARAGDTLLPAGRLVRAAEVAVAASCGCAKIKVFSQPKVAIVATGDELVEIDQQPESWQIRNSNSYALATLVRGEGGHAGRLKIALDTRQELGERVAQGRMWDLLLFSGGMSMGKYDLVEEVLAEVDAEFLFTGALIQPGRPVVFGRLPARHHHSKGTLEPECYFFGLPGNPISTQVCFHLFVVPMLRALAGRTRIGPRFVEATLAEDVKGGAHVTRFLPAELESSWDAVRVRVVGWQGSGDVAANARGNCYVVLPAGVEAFRAGETVRVLLR